MIKKIILILLAMFLAFGLSAQEKQLQKQPVEISIPEVYELANIILAITPYGIEDKWEVRKQGEYYEDVMKHFSKYSSHPLIEKVNYSREKWEQYLSFRTDSYAFSFDKDGKVIRNFKFRATQFNEFEENLALVEDFAKVSGFRKFYKKHKKYYDKLAVNYAESQMIPEMLAFLTEQFGDYFDLRDVKYGIAASPLVYRMNCQRSANGKTVDFITVPDVVLGIPDDEQTPESRKASDLHMLFTEMDHAFVGPISKKHKDLVQNNFVDSKWNKGSGYERWPGAVFDEYMTWAVYDVYLYKYFPDVAAQISKVWAKQNETRGFIHAYAFNAKVLELYKLAEKQGKTLKDIYPELLQWCKDVEF